MLSGTPIRCRSFWLRGVTGVARMILDVRDVQISVLAWISFYRASTMVGAPWHEFRGPHGLYRDCTVLPY